MKKQTLLLIRGIPGSGKSAIAHALSQKIGISSVCLLDPDAIDFEDSAYKELVRELKSNGVDEKFYPYRYLRAKAHKAIEEGKHIIWNQAFTDLTGLQKTVDNLTAHANEHHAKLRVVIIEVTVGADIARNRIDERVRRGGHDVDKDRFEKFVADYRSFVGEGFDIIQVSGEDQIEESVDMLMRTLS